MSSFPIFQSLEHLGARYAFYLRREGQGPIFHSNAASENERFLSASIIKIPILLAWIALEKDGQVHRAELCRLDDEPQVQGAGFSWLLRARQLPFQDVVLMMIALSDNLCTNLVIRRIGLERLEQIFQDQLGLTGTHLQRKLMDYAARERGLDNWITPADCIRYFERIKALPPSDRAWVESMLAVNQDDLLLMRRIQRDTLTFYHKTGSMTGVLHDWGYTDQCEIFLLCNQVRDEIPAYEVFGELGRLMVEPAPL
jgi:beta-lactamase class A